MRTMRSEGSKRNQQWKLMKIVCLPITILCKVRDLYVKSMVVCAVGAGYGGGIVSHTPPEASPLPRSFSVGSSMSNDAGEEFRQHLRARSMHGIDGKLEQKMQQQQQSSVNQRTMGPSAGRIMGMRSYSVGIGKIGRIDEDEPCCFVEDEIDAMADIMYPQSRYGAFRRTLIVSR